MAIFKAYDVRGRYPDQIDAAIAERISNAAARWLGARMLVVGRDVRRAAPVVAEAVVRGAVRAGANVLDLGVCTTPMLYFAVGHLGAHGGIMVTASHNPPDDIGLKICRAEAVPVGRGSGLEEIERLSHRLEGPGGGRVELRELRPEYRTHLRRFIDPRRRLKIAVDAAGGAVTAVFDAVFGDAPADFVRLCFRPDPEFRTHEPDPLKDQNVRDLVAAVRAEGCDFGVAFDGDGDRCMLFDENGERIPSDLVTVLLARSALAAHPGAAVVYDLRSSRVVPEEIRRAGGRPVRERVGHAFIKQTMRRLDAVLGGELSGHYYFREHYHADSGLMAFARVWTIFAQASEPPSALVHPLERTARTGEVNFRVEDPTAALERVVAAFPGRPVDRLDGVTIETERGWFNLRPSNTEPLLRLNLEAQDAQARDELLSRIQAALGNRP